ncbi:hypothetical protein CP978_14300 [Streptomyces nodosus]|uniref:Membrane protein n=2 Tax=Streptomyces nodosus TaxID=40318 RepID=A0A0B5DKQ0_9ACTN|nr:membrane protein [Streptomyces nodosus]QEV39572.1 hypothetical protein CP978_14300 [Streptomyces nodosus]
MDARDADLKKELHATLQARRELGEEYESALVDSFMEKIEQRLDGTIDRRLRRQLAEQQMTVARGARSPGTTDSWGERFGFAVVSLVLAIPLSAIAGAFGHLAGVLLAWVGIVGVNVVQAARTHPGLFGLHTKSSQDEGWKD